MMQDFMKQITVILENTESHMEAFTREDTAEPRTEEKIPKTDENTDVLEGKLFE